MKKIFTLLFILIVSAQLSLAQTNLTTAVDFTATDVDGNTFNLFNTLNSGKYVVIDFMFTTCQPCQGVAPKLWQAFTNYGCNGAGAQIHFISINRDDNNTVMQNWPVTYMNPTGPYPQGVSGTQGGATGGSQSFDNLYNIAAYPTMILIAPNGQIVEQDMWPIPTAAAFTAYFTPYGLSPLPCTVGLNDLENSSELISVSPVPATDEITIASKDNINEVKIMSALGNLIFARSYSDNVRKDVLDVSTLAAGVYFTVIRVNDSVIVKKKFVKL